MTGKFDISTLFKDESLRQQPEYKAPAKDSAIDDVTLYGIPPHIQQSLLGSLLQLEFAERKEHLPAHIPLPLMLSGGGAALSILFEKPIAYHTASDIFESICSGIAADLSIPYGNIAASFVQNGQYKIAKQAIESRKRGPSGNTPS